MEPKEYLSKKLEELIENKKDENYKNTVKKQAKEIDIPYPTFNKYLRAETECSISNIVRIAQYYNVSTDYLLDLTENPTPNNDLNIVYDYTGLSQAAINKIRKNRKYPLVSKIIESNEFWNIFKNILSAVSNLETLEPSGKTSADLAAAKMGFKINWNNDNENVDLSNLPIEYQKYLGVVAEQGTKPLYKYQLTETIVRLFEKIIEEAKRKNNL